MKFSEMSKFTNRELANFTHLELALSSDELLQRIKDDDRPIPPSVLARLDDLCKAVNSSTLDPDKKKGFVIGLFKKISHLTGIIIRLHDLFETGYDTYVWLHPYAEGLIDALKDYFIDNPK
jgi:hypothetical protein